VRPCRRHRRHRWQRWANRPPSPRESNTASARYPRRERRRQRSRAVVSGRSIDPISTTRSVTPSVAVRAVRLGSSGPSPAMTRRVGKPAGSAAKARSRRARFFSRRNPPRLPMVRRLPGAPNRSMMLSSGARREAGGVDPVWDVSHRARLQPPDPGGDAKERLRGHDDAGAAAEHQTAEHRPTRQLPIGAFVRPETVLEMDVARHERTPALGQDPFDRTPIVCQQHIRPCRGKVTTNTDKIGKIDRAALWQAPSPSW